MRDVICNICNIGQKSYYVWKNKTHTILIKLLEKYFNENELIEFLETGKIKKFESADFLQNLVIEKNRLIYLESFTKKNPFGSLMQSHIDFVDFYFSFLNDLSRIEKFNLDFNFCVSNYINYDFNFLLNQYLLTYSIKKYQNQLDNFKIDYEEEKKMNLIQQSEDYSKKSIEDGYRLNLLELHFNLNKHFEIFNTWDSYMLLFLEECFKSNFEILYNENDEKIYKEEALYHIKKYKEKLDGTPCI